MFLEKGVSVVQCRERHGIKGDILAQLCHMFAVAIFLSPLSNRSHQFVSSLFVGTALSHQTFCKKKEFVLLKILTSSLFAMHHANYELDQIKISSKIREAPQIKKRENVGIFPKWGTPPPPPCLGMTRL